MSERPRRSYLRRPCRASLPRQPNLQDRRPQTAVDDLRTRPPAPSWGNILADGCAFIRNSPWLVIAGGVPLILTTLGFTFLGEALRDTFDPRLRRSI